MAAELQQLVSQLGNPPGGNGKNSGRNQETGSRTGSSEHLALA
jgi:hypothetical protein